MSNSYCKFSSYGTGLPPAVGCVPLVIGLMFLVSAGYYETRYFLFGQTTAGVIDRIERPLSWTYVFIRFRDASGQEKICRQTLLMREVFTVGESVRLRYLPGDPPRGRIETFWQYWHPLVLKPVLGVLSLAAATALFRRRFFGLSAPKR